MRKTLLAISFLVEEEEKDILRSLDYIGYNPKNDYLHIKLEKIQDKLKYIGTMLLLMSGAMLEKTSVL